MNRFNGIQWTNEMLTILRSDWNAGVSTVNIARHMSELFPALKFTKNTVIGKAHRLGLPSRQSPILHGPTKPKETKPVLPIPPRSAVPDLFIVPSKPLPVALVPLRVVAATGLRGGCQYPLWSHRERPKYDRDGMPLVCGDPREVGSYCGTHGAVCFVQRRQRVEEAA